MAMSQCQNNNNNASRLKIGNNKKTKEKGKGNSLFCGSKRDEPRGRMLQHAFQGHRSRRQQHRDHHVKGAGSDLPHKNNEQNKTKQNKTKQSG